VYVSGVYKAMLSFIELPSFAAVRDKYLDKEEFERG